MVKSGWKFIRESRSVKTDGRRTIWNINSANAGRSRVSTIGLTSSMRGLNGRCIPNELLDLFGKNGSPSPWPSPPGEGGDFAFSESFEGLGCHLSATLASCQSARMVHPLPGGEGRGEGEPSY